MEPILKFSGETRWLSNFHECEIEYEGIVYPTTEHAYQAQKTLNIRVRKAIAKLPKPMDAAVVGRELRLREDWFNMSLQIMYDVNYIKFSKHEDLKQRLLATGNVHLEEGNTWNDTFWGTCNGIGENHLGKTLMKVREQLRKNFLITPTKFDPKDFICKPGVIPRAS